MCKDNAVQESSFKVGDKVRVVSSIYSPEANNALGVGSVATVAGFSKLGIPRIVFEGHREAPNGVGWPFYNDWLELVS